MKHKPTSIIVTGTSGLLGGYLITRWNKVSNRLANGVLASHGLESFTIHGFDRNYSNILNTYAVDLTDSSMLANAIAEIEPSFIVNCAAMTNLDVCETAKETAAAVNAEAVQTLAEMARRVGARLIQISTDAVFGDQGHQPYAETDDPQPINVYGRTKLAGEEATLSSPNNLVVRTTIFGWNTVRQKRSFGEWMYDTIQNRRLATVFSDVRFAPIYVPIFAKFLEIAINVGLVGVYHIAGADVVSKETFIREAARQMECDDSNLSSGTLSDVVMKAPRSRNMALDSTKFAKTCGVRLPDHRESLAAFFVDAQRRKKHAPVSNR